MTHFSSFSGFYGRFHREWFSSFSCYRVSVFWQQADGTFKKYKATLDREFSNNMTYLSCFYVRTASFFWKIVKKLISWVHSSSFHNSKMYGYSLFANWKFRIFVAICSWLVLWWNFNLSPNDSILKKVSLKHTFMDFSWENTQLCWLVVSKLIDPHRLMRVSLEREDNTT